MKNIKTITTFTLILLLSATVFGQERKAKKPNKEKIKAMKIGYITEKLSLTSEEAQKFWPVYNEFETKRENLYAERKKLRKNEKTEKVELTNEQIEEHINTHFVIRQKGLDLEKEYHAKFKAVLPIKKVAKLYRANEQFKKDLLRKIKTHRSGTNGEHPQRKKRTSTDF